MNRRTSLAFIMLAAVIAVAGCESRHAATGANPSPAARPAYSHGGGANTHRNTSGETPAPTAGPAEMPAPAESNPPGDIPDTQALVTYSSPADGYSIDVPEGWERSTHGHAVSFVDKFDGVGVVASASPATLASIEAQTRAGRDFKSRMTRLPGGIARIISYTSNSNPDPVTGKKIRLENVAALFIRDRRSATLMLWAPLGADNADMWNQIERTFRWR